ncbi:MAG: phosphoribosylglycinamide formyltransferase 1 [Parcubacteria group bacterium Athens0714_26]|nr:MAG: phosphoribosylglycinamide formyltransferase 1 [Parcubacteria group bacterium Athens1014_26]TSD03715.1 MAG: phosphoribosylglycinamide formyltransferase 1 [Parcubacteria group bacterium Athens0714_26]
MNSKFNAAVFIGNGGRLKAIYDCFKKIANAKTVLIISDKISSRGIDWVKAKDKNINAFCFPLKKWLGDNPTKTRKDFNIELAEILKSNKINLVVLAGWDVVLSDDFLKNFPNQVINIHPALCPAFPGMHSEKQAMDYGVKYTGCTLHFVDVGVDTGQIIFQEVVKIGDGDTLEELQEKIHQKEEYILIKGIKAICAGNLLIKGRRVIIKK